MKQRVEALELIPSGGGCFEVSVGDELLYSKLDTGEFPDDRELLDVLAERVA